MLLDPLATIFLLPQGLPVAFARVLPTRQQEDVRVAHVLSIQELHLAF
jgi:hypothetical protein